MVGPQKHRQQKEHKANENASRVSGNGSSSRFSTLGTSNYPLVSIAGKQVNSTRTFALDMAGSSDDPLSRFLEAPVSQLEYLINHVVFPPKLPQSDDSSTENSAALLDLVLDAVQTYAFFHPGHAQWEAFTLTIEECHKVHHQGLLNSSEVFDSLKGISTESDATRLFYLAAQNAAILIRNPHAVDKIIIEAFEVSPENSQVFLDNGALTRSFPDAAVAIPQQTFEDASFLDQFADCIVRLSSEEVSDYVPISRKAGTNLAEIRDTVIPSLVTEMLMTLLQAIGERVVAKTTVKRTHEEVLWDQTFRPFRRSPLWLVLRVGMQRILQELCGDEEGLLHYKNLIALIISKICNNVTLAAVEISLAISASSKLARRLHKIQVDPLLEGHFKTVLQRSEDYVNSRWTKAMSSCGRHLLPLPTDAEPIDLELSMTSSRAYLNTVLSYEAPTASEAYFSPRCEPRSANDANDIPNMATAKLPDFDVLLRLFDFEDWVAQHLSHWVSMQTSDLSVRKLSEAISDYEMAARPVYLSDPEQNSVMLLTLMDLWCALDKQVVSLHPLLKNYHPEIPVKFLESALLSRPRDMERLARVEEYLIRRHLTTTSSVFEDPHSSSFSSVYYDETSDLQDLHDRILKKDQTEIQKKKEELARLQQEHTSLTRRMEAQACSYYTVRVKYGRTEQRHANRNCKKCDLRSAANNLEIKPYESPLPNDDVQAKAAVFALRTPLAFSIWRNVTWHMVQDLGRTDDSQDEGTCKVLLRDYDGLRSYRNAKDANDQRTRRVQLGSTTKSFQKSHYGKPLKISDASDDRVCLPNGLRYRLYDSELPGWTYDQPACLKANESYFASPLSPQSHYHSVRSTFDEAGHTPNSVIARRSACPTSLRLNEFQAMMNVRSRTLLQWDIILYELALPNLDFSKAESSILFSHTAVQCGPRQNGSPLTRGSHWQLEDKDFCFKLLQCLDQRFRSTCVNWRQRYCLRTVVILVLRLILLSTCREVVTNAQALLKKIRSALFQWTISLRQEMRNSTDEKTLTRRKDDTMWAAILCRRTYMAYAWSLEASKDQQPIMEDLYYWVSCSLLLNNIVQAPLKEYQLLDQMELLQDRRICHSLETSIRCAIATSPELVNLAVCEVWPGCREVRPWQAFSSPNERWISCETVASEAEHHKSVTTLHYNILDGTLLVDGKLLGRLPTDYTSDADYVRLFGKKSFDVFPSSLPGMEYHASSTFEGLEVHFGGRSGKLCLRIKLEDTILELIPQTQFANFEHGQDFPRSLLEDCVHWLNLDTGILEIRPLAAWWRADHDVWKIDLNDAKAHSGRQELVDIRSPLHSALTQQFLDFESSCNILITRGPSSSEPTQEQLSVVLPRFDLHFIINDQGRLYCPEMRAVVVEHQDVGTLFGLSGKLVLLRDGLRFVLVPRGDVLIQKSSQHTVVRVQTEGQSRVFCAIFYVDPVLGRLVRPSELCDVYYLAYLHAITSSGIPDPLTQCSGTEEALSILRSGLAQPWCPLDLKCNTLLSEIEALTPKRKFYPTELRNMQQVTWDARLPTTAQHDEFLIAVLALRSHSARFDQFYGPPSESIELQYSKQNTLPERARVKNARYWNSDLHFSTPANPTDVRHKPRKGLFGPEGEARVYETSKLVLNWASNESGCPSVSQEFEKLRNIAGFHQDFGLTTLDELLHLDLSEQWGALFHTWSRISRISDSFQLMFLASTISFGKAFGPRMESLRILLAVAFNPTSVDLVPPASSAYAAFALREMLEDVTIDECTESQLDQFIPNQEVLWGSPTEEEITVEKQREQQHERRCIDAQKCFAADVKAQWPSEMDVQRIRHSDVLHIGNAAKDMEPLWLQRVQNYQLFEFAIKVQHKLARCPRRSILDFSPDQGLNGENTSITASLSQQPTLESTLEHVVERLRRSKAPQSSPPIQRNVKQESSTEEEQILRDTIRKLSTYAKSVNEGYAADLDESLQAWTSKQSHVPKASVAPTPSDLELSIETSHRKVRSRLCQLKGMGKTSEAFRWLQYGQLWPRYTLSAILRMLGQNATKLRNVPVGEFILELALSVTELQRFIRLWGFQTARKTVQFMEELSNVGHEDWDPEDYPQWLLLEIESNLLIRSEQVQVAREIMFPSSGNNATFQLNMGKGKTSVILPMVALMLADREMLLRIIVPKPLLPQASQIIRLRLGGLLGRTMYHVPFFRATSTDVTTTHAYRGLLQSCLSQGGVLMSLPEHILSFKLSGLERLSAEKIAEATAMLEVQQWLSTVSRDVLDECDEILHPRQQLIYPSGKQFPIDNSPSRWKTAQTVLELIRSCLRTFVAAYPNAIQVVEKANGAFPEIHIVDKELEGLLVCAVAKDICTGKGGILPVSNLTAEQLRAIEVFLLSPPSGEDNTQKIECLSEGIRKTVLLLRGLLGLRILPLALNKRWNVEYGLHPSRCLVSVPYRGKGVPSASAEFGHPDVAILLTLLSYYSSGISASQFRTSLTAVLDSDDPSEEYDQWVQCHGSVPKHLQDHTAINLEDDQQMERLYAEFKRTVATANHFCNTIVFPKEAREFEKKLVSSTWDLVIENFPAPSSSALRDSVRSTGFSGTNDFSRLLPLSIPQRHLADLRHTNAEVLVHLLRPHNRSYLRIADEQGRKLSIPGFIDLLVQQVPATKILLDAGAQILDLNNRDFVQLWLAISKKAPAAIYFDDADQAMVLHRDGRNEVLSASSYASDSGECLVYMDEPHCRGTDMKFPADARAALTVGPHQTKDHTAQAAMRMRELAHSQSILWLSPPEVHQSIIKLTRKSKDEKLSSVDVIHWILEQTCRKIELYQPLYVSHGLGYCARQSALDVYNLDPNDESSRANLLSVMEQPETRTLDELYLPSSTTETPPAYVDMTSTSRFADYELSLKQFQAEVGSERFLTDSSAHEEQERELAVEVEEERHVQRPPPAKPLDHDIHEDVKHFVSKGLMPPSPQGVKPVFAASEGTSLQKLFKDPKMGGILEASQDFLNTVDSEHLDDYQRPVSWLLWSDSSSQCLAISPYEAERLLPLLKGQKRVYMIQYAAPVSRQTLHFDRMQFRSIPTLPRAWQPPTWLVRAVGLFAGRTFFSWKEANAMCAFLDLPKASDAEDADTAASVKPLMKKPLRVVHKWTMLRHGADFSYSPMGYLCSERVLKKDHAFFKEG